MHPVVARLSHEVNKRTHPNWDIQMEQRPLKKISKVFTTKVLAIHYSSYVSSRLLCPCLSPCGEKCHSDFDRSIALYLCPRSVHAGYIRTDRSLLLGHDALLSQKIAGDLSTALSHSTAFWWTSQWHWLDELITHLYIWIDKATSPGMGLTIDGWIIDAYIVLSHCASPSQWTRHIIVL